MTVCIAAQFKMDDGKPAFVLCSDGRLSAGEAGSDDATVKVHLLGYNLMAMMAADDWDAVRALCEQLEHETKSSGRPRDKQSFILAVLESTQRFCESVLCPDVATLEVLVTGFINKVPLIAAARVENRGENKTASVRLRFDKWAIGEGALAADFILKHRGLDSLNTDLATACYIVYEAKKFSEIVTSVGPTTSLIIHAPMEREPESADILYSDLNIAGYEELEGWRKSFSLRPITEIRGRPFKRFCGNPPDRQRES